MMARQRGRLALLVALMVASAATEGAALVLFVPMLAAIGGGTDVLAATGGHIGHLLGAIGVAKALGPLLIIFVVLALARALFNQARDITQHRLVNDALDALRTRAWTALLHCEWRTLSAMRRSDGTALLITEVERFGGGLNQLLGALATVLTLGGLDRKSVV